MRPFFFFILLLSITGCSGLRQEDIGGQIAYKYIYVVGGNSLIDGQHLDLFLTTNESVIQIVSPGKLAFSFEGEDGSCYSDATEYECDGWSFKLMDDSAIYNYCVPVASYDKDIIFYSQSLHISKEDNHKDESFSICLLSHVMNGFAANITFYYN